MHERTIRAPQCALVGRHLPVTGHEQEFRAFVAAATPDLRRTAWLLCRDERLADALVQQALYRTYLAWDEARERDQLAYARRVLANLRIDLWRRHRRERLHGAGPRGPEPAVAHDSDPLGRALATVALRRRGTGDRVRATRLGDGA